MLHITKTFEKGNTVYFECLYRAIDGEFKDPTSPAWVIKTIRGVTEDSGGPTKREDGVWYFFWTPVTVGDYILTFSGTIEENAVVVKRKFKVVDTRLK